MDDDRSKVTLRDFFAGMALAGHIAKHGIRLAAEYNAGHDHDFHASEAAYRQADCMMRERDHVA